jgi:hypothetical protein
MRLKIRGGTVNHGDPSLCSTCRFATIVKGQRLRDEIVECQRLSDRSRIAFPVTACSEYSDQRIPSLGDMEDIAWILRSDPRRNQIGFVEARKLKPRDRYVLRDDLD